MDEYNKKIFTASFIGVLILLTMIIFSKISFDKLSDSAERTRINNPNGSNGTEMNVNCVVDWQLSDMLVCQLACPQDENIKVVIRDGYKEYFNSNQDISVIERKISKKLGNRKSKGLTSIPVTVGRPTSVKQICDIIKKRPAFNATSSNNVVDPNNVNTNSADPNGTGEEKASKYYQDFIVTSNKEGIYTVYMIFYDTGDK